MTIVPEPLTEEEIDALVGAGDAACVVDRESDALRGVALPGDEEELAAPPWPGAGP